MSDDHVAFDGELEAHLLRFIEKRFLSGVGESAVAAAESGLTPDTPLLEWGLLDSLRVMILVNHIRNDLKLSLRSSVVGPATFRTVRDIVATVRREVQAETTP